jgi:undecaprenyl-diphosphatase
VSDYVQAVIWGLVQGLTEFLPVSSSGHLVIVPEALGVAPPDLAMSAVLHLGTLLAVIVHYRSDLRRLVTRLGGPETRWLLWLLVIGTAPAGLALVFESQLEALQASTTAVGIALVGTGVVLWLSALVQDGTARLEDATWPTAVVVGFAQLLAVIPGVSRSGMTMTAGMGRGLSRHEAARFSFLLGVPTIAAAGFIEGVEVVGEGRLGGPELVGIAVAAVSGYAAISILLRMLERTGLRPFSYYCLVVGALTIALL